jgi:hypothetical protein
VASLTYTTASKLSVTMEWQHNGAALDRAGWQALRSQSPAALAAYLGQAADLQDNAARSAIFLYLTQRDLGWRNVDLTALLKLNRDDRSRLAWMELRWRLDRVDLALQWQHAWGESGSEFGSFPLRHSLGFIVSAYF